MARLLAGVTFHQAGPKLAAPMGVIADFRGQGIGERLMRTTVEAAIKKGMTRIELEVRTGNAAAIKLYKKVGFELEGTRRAAGFQDGAYYDLHHMSLLAGDARR
jgi:putative acetyltransferase